MAVGGMGVSVGGMGVSFGGMGVSVGGMGVAVGGMAVLVLVARAVLVLFAWAMLVKALEVRVRQFSKSSFTTSQAAPRKSLGTLLKTIPPFNVTNNIKT